MIFCPNTGRAGSSCFSSSTFMARPLRIIDPNFVYHITTRGVDKRNITLDEDDRRAFVHLLGSTVQEMKWILHCWVLMSNHLHLVVRAPKANLSTGMQQLLSTYAARFNKNRARIGHLFHRRFGAKPVKDEAHLLEVLRYVPLNPVRAGMVTAPEQWRWSSYRATAGLEAAPPWLEVDWTLSQFHSVDSKEARQRYRDFVSRASLDAIERLERMFIAEELRRRGRGPARKLFVHLAHDECGLTFTAIACRLGITLAGAANLYATSHDLAASSPEYKAALILLRDNLRKGSDPFLKLCESDLEPVDRH